MPIHKSPCLWLPQLHIKSVETINFPFGGLLFSNHTGKQLFKTLNFQGKCGKTGANKLSSRYLLLAGLDHTKARQSELSRFLHFLCSNLSQKVQDLIWCVVSDTTTNIFVKKTTRDQSSVLSSGFCGVALLQTCCICQLRSKSSLAHHLHRLSHSLHRSHCVCYGVLLEMRKSLKGDRGQTAAKTWGFESTHQVIQMFCKQSIMTGYRRISEAHTWRGGYGPEALQSTSHPWSFSVTCIRFGDLVSPSYRMRRESIAKPAEGVAGCSSWILWSQWLSPD